MTYKLTKYVSLHDRPIKEDPANGESSDKFNFQSKDFDNIAPKIEMQRLAVKEGETHNLVVKMEMRTEIGSVERAMVDSFAHQNDRGVVSEIDSSHDAKVQRILLSTRNIFMCSFADFYVCGIWRHPRR